MRRSGGRKQVAETLTYDKLRPVRNIVRKLLVLVLALWLPAFAGAAAASAVCKDSAKAGHGHEGARTLMSIAEGDAGSGDDGLASDCSGCDPCYSHCTLSLPGAGFDSFAPEHGAVAPAVPAALISLSFPPADRPPLFRLG